MIRAQGSERADGDEGGQSIAPIDSRVGGDEAPSPVA